MISTSRNRLNKNQAVKVDKKSLHSLTYCLYIYVRTPNVNGIGKKLDIHIFVRNVPHSICCNVRRMKFFFENHLIQGMLKNSICHKFCK